jgi:hypothetical protein
MKKTILILVGAVGIAVAAYAAGVFSGIYANGAGSTFGDTGASISFYGHSVITQQTSVATLTNGCTVNELVAAVNGLSTNIIKTGLLK